jgi:hypothetical protein
MDLVRFLGPVEGQKSTRNTCGLGKAGQDLVEVRYYGMKDVTSVGCLLYIRACSYKVVGNVKPR